MFNNKKEFKLNTYKLKLCLVISSFCFIPNISYSLESNQNENQIIKSKLNEPQQSYTQIGNNGHINNKNANNKLSNMDYDPFSSDSLSKPAWAQGAYQSIEFNKLLPYGSDLFTGNFASTYQTDINLDYIVSPGDKIIVRMWGAKNYEDILNVDIQGNIFIPEIGPIKVAGVSTASLVPTIKDAVSKVFTNNVELYVNLQSSQPVAIFVTGAVTNPGRYAGSQNDCILSYIDRAGGIDPFIGSYREITIKRNSEIIKNIDLYDFITDGNLPNISLKNNDVIVVSMKKNSVSAYGVIKKPATYEFLPTLNKGKNLLKYIPLGTNVTHVQISGIKNSKPFNKYMPINEFPNYSLNNDDRIMFIADTQNETLVASVIGPINGNSRYIIPKGSYLTDVLANIRVDPKVAELDSIYIRRKSVAIQQKIIIDEALKRLEQASLTAESGSVDEAQIRVKEAELIQDFVKRAQSAQPDGVVVVSTNGKINDIMLEDGDEIIIPQRSDVVQIGGEVLMPKAIVFNKNFTIKDYINETGGFSQRADEDTILVVLPNGQVGNIEQLSIQPGSRIIVMPKVDTKKMQFAKDIMQIIYQIAVATKVAVGL